MDTSAELGFGTQIRRSPSFDATVRWGAQGFSVHDHTCIPRDFGEPERDFRNLVTDAVLCDVAVRRQVEATGPDADADSDTDPFALGLDRLVDLDTDAEFIGEAALRRIRDAAVSRRRAGLVIDGPRPPANGPSSTPTRRWRPGRGADEDAAVLKSLGITIAQVAQRLRGEEPTLADDRDVAQRTVRRAERRRQMKTIVTLAAIFVVMVAAFSTLFHELMEREGRSYSWPTSVYWTLTTMTTLGFGDITFESDAGRIFSIVVLLSGSTFLLVMLPFVFIQFVFVPWMNERERRRAPRALPRSAHGHLILTEFGPVEQALVERAEQAQVPYVILVDDVDAAGRIHDEGRRVIVGALDDPETYRNARVERAAMVITTRNDPTNTNVAFTVREIAPDIEVLATANTPASVDILEIAGVDHVLQLGEILGSAMAARALGTGGTSHVIGEFAGLEIAEAGVVGTAMVDRTLGQLALRRRFGVGIIGIWDRGEFSVPTGDSVLRDSSMLLLAASDQQLTEFDAHYTVESPTAHRAVIIGGGRVGRAIGSVFHDEGVSFAIVDKLPERERPGARYVIGDAADRSVLEEAGLADAGAVLITTHEDDVNVYLTRYCRGLRPDARIVSRSRLDRNVTTLYRAGADAVLSYSGTGSAAIWNHFRGDETLLIAQGLNVFRASIPRELAGRTLAETHLYRRTRCNVVAIDHDDRIEANPDAHRPLPADGELILVGTDDAQVRFTDEFGVVRRRVRRPHTPSSTPPAD